MQRNREIPVLSRALWSILLLLLFCVVNFTCTQKGGFSSSGYTITVSFTGEWREDSVYFYSYIGETEQRKDSLLMGTDQQVIFHGDEYLEAGMYTIKSKYCPIGIDFFISAGASQKFKITYNPSEGIPSLKVSGSPENKAFMDYMKFSSSKQEERLRLEAHWREKANIPDSAEAIRLRINQLIKEVELYSATQVKKHSATTFALFLRSIQEVEAPTPDIPDNAANRDSLLQLYYYHFYKEHYLDNIDFADERTIRMPFIERKLQMYFFRVLPPDKDVLCEQVDAVLAKTNNNREVYEFVVRDLYGLFRDTPFPELYQVAIYIGDNYVLKESEKWEDKEYVAKMSVAIRAAKLHPLGQPATDLHLQTSTGKNLSLHNLQSPYTLLYFYDPDCASCNAMTPEVYRLYMEYRHKGLQVYAVYIEGNKEIWEKYINEHKYQWIDVWDEHNNQNLYEKYDLHAIPMMLLLDKNKVVLAKDFLPDMLEYLLKQL